MTQTASQSDAMINNPWRWSAIEAKTRGEKTVLVLHLAHLLHQRNVMKIKYIKINSKRHSNVLCSERLAIMKFTSTGGGQTKEANNLDACHDTGTPYIFAPQ
jgi:hypothetical protein